MMKSILNFRSMLLIATCAVFLILPISSLADPVPDPEVAPGYEDPVGVLCFLMSDIGELTSSGRAKARQADETGGTFRFQFQSLNWANQPAYGVTIIMNIGTSEIVGSRPSLIGGNIDADGRPFGVTDNPGEHLASVTTNNQWNVSQASPTKITWSGVVSPIAAIDLLDGSQIPSSEPLPPNTVRPIQVGEPMIDFMSFADPSDPTSVDPLTIDDGPNVLDGFVFLVTDFDPGEVISLNWFLLDQNGNPIGTAAGGNPYGFGVVNLKRVDGGIAFNQGIFEGNTGFDQSNRSFFGTIFDGGDDYEFAVEFGASLTAPFINPDDNSFGAEVNATLKRFEAFLPLIIQQPTPTQPGFENLVTPTPAP